MMCPPIVMGRGINRGSPHAVAVARPSPPGFGHERSVIFGILSMVMPDPIHTLCVCLIRCLDDLRGQQAGDAGTLGNPQFLS